MSIEVKQIMLKNLEKEFGRILTVDTLNEVLKTVADELDYYTLEQTDESNFDFNSIDMLNAFLFAKELEGRSPKTIERYRYIITRLLTYTKTPIRKLTVYHLRKYLMELKIKGCSDTTLEGIREVFSSFFNWLSKEKLIIDNPVISLTTIKCATK